MLKTFSFYLEDTEVEDEVGDLASGASIGFAIRHNRLCWDKKEVKKKGVKVTVWLSQERMKSFRMAKLNGLINLAEGVEYSPENIIEAIMQTECCSIDCTICPCANTWYARAEITTLEE